MTRFYKQIANANDLQALQYEAEKEGMTAIGISTSGQLYRYDSLQKRVVNTNEVYAANLLETTIDNIRKIVETKGEFQIVDELETLLTLPGIEDLEGLPAGEHTPLSEEIAECNCDELKEVNTKLQSDNLRLTEEVRTLNDENTKLLFANVELETKAKKEPPISLEAAIKFVKANGYELKIK